MFLQKNASRRNRARRGAHQRGQSIVIALLVLLLLGLAGTLFVTIVARNVINAQHANRTITADQYGRAGIAFADAQLSNSLDGADWRPALQCQLANPPTEARELARYSAATLPAANPNDPDIKYLQAGYTRYNTGAGRFLLRVTYTPVLLRDTLTSPYFDPVVKTDSTGAEIPVAVPPGKYLKIESIGREGVIDPNDPTTFPNNRSSDRLQAYQVAYKPIAITDYAKFETNLQNRADFANLGVTSTFDPSNTDGGIVTPGVYDFLQPTTSSAPLQRYPVVTVYGAPDAYKLSGSSLLPNPTAGTLTAIDTSKAYAGGGSFHANMPVRFFGENVVYLNNAGPNAPLYQDTVEVAGDLLLNGYMQANPLFTTSASPANPGQRAALILNPSDLANVSGGASTNATTNNNATANAYVVPSNDNPAMGSVNGGFSTHGGLVRDGSSGTDINSQPRGVGRLEPPLMDATESGSRLPRYKAIATLSAPRVNPVGGVYPAGSSQYGYGQSIYINNVDDLQPNSKTIGGGSTMVDEWLNRTSVPAPGSKGGWIGDFYEPPGVNITLGRQNVSRSSPVSTYGIHMTRTDAVWPNTDGSTGTTKTQVVLFDDINASNDPAATGKSNPDNDVLIYAEGNVRVHGIVSADPADADSAVTTGDKYPRHITIVTNGTAYIEGSLLKGNPDSSITILAHDYVCVNTTQLLAGPQVDEVSLGTPSPKGNSDPNFHALTFEADETRLVQDLTFGLPNGGTAQSAYNGLLGLYISGRVQGADSGVTQADIDIVNPATGYSIRQPVGGVSPLPFGKDGTGAFSITSPTFDATNPGRNQRQFFNLNPPNPGTPIPDYSVTPNTVLTNLVESDARQLHIRLNTSLPEAKSLELERIAVLPADVRIEAVLYAQTGSFFVIPGFWFDSDGTDRLDTFAKSVNGAAPGGVRVSGAASHFPFFGQPIDMKITIDGAVSEAQPADVANQTAWMLKWGLDTAVSRLCFCGDTPRRCAAGNRRPCSRRNE